MNNETFDVFDYIECYGLECPYAYQEYCYDGEDEWCWEDCYAEPGDYCERLGRIVAK